LDASHLSGSTLEIALNDSNQKINGIEHYIYDGLEKCTNFFKAENETLNSLERQLQVNWENITQRLTENG